MKTEDTMNTSRNHPASPNRKSKRDMMMENQKIWRTKESRQMKGDDKGVKDHQKKIDKIGGRKKFDKFVGPTELWQKIEMDDREKKIKLSHNKSERII